MTLTPRPGRAPRHLRARRRRINQAAPPAAPALFVADGDADGLVDARKTRRARAAGGDTDDDRTPTGSTPDDDGDDDPHRRRAPGQRRPRHPTATGRPTTSTPTTTTTYVPTRAERDRGVSVDSDADGYADHLDADDNHTRPQRALRGRGAARARGSVGGYACRVAPGTRGDAFGLAFVAFASRLAPAARKQSRHCSRTFSPWIQGLAQSEIVRKNLKRLS